MISYAIIWLNENILSKIFTQRREVEQERLIFSSNKLY
jgi:hypothetical protein